MDCDGYKKTMERLYGGVWERFTPKVLNIGGVSELAECEEGYRVLDPSSNVNVFTYIHETKHKDSRPKAESFSFFIADVFSPIEQRTKLSRSRRYGVMFDYAEHRFENGELRRQFQIAWLLNGFIVSYDDFLKGCHNLPREGGVAKGFPNKEGKLNGLGLFVEGDTHWFVNWRDDVIDGMVFKFKVVDGNYRFHELGFYENGKRTDLFKDVSDHLRALPDVEKIKVSLYAQARFH